MSATESVLACRDLSKTFGEGDHAIQVLRKIDLSIAQGELLAIVGASGSGKSTLLHLLGGLDTPSRGEVTLLGQRFDKMSDEQMKALADYASGLR